MLAGFASNGHQSAPVSAGSFGGNASRWRRRYWEWGASKKKKDCASLSVFSEDLRIRNTTGLFSLVRSNQPRGIGLKDKTKPPTRSRLYYSWILNLPR